MLYRAWRYRWKVEAAEIRFLLRAIRPGQTVVDIGAHKGALTYWMQRCVGPLGQVFAFEPQPELADYLVCIKSALRMDHVTVVNGAMSSRCGTCTMVRPFGKPWPSAMITSEQRPDEEAVLVKSHTLDDFFRNKQRHPVHFIKCDVEGHEYDVFRGGEGVLRRDRPTLLFECERRHHPQRRIGHIFRYLEGLGYEGYFFARPRGGLRPLSELSETQLAVPHSNTYTRNFVFCQKDCDVNLDC